MKFKKLGICLVTYLFTKTRRVISYWKAPCIVKWICIKNETGVTSITILHEDIHLIHKKYQSSPELLVLFDKQGM